MVYGLKTGKVVFPAVLQLKHQLLFECLLCAKHCSILRVTGMSKTDENPCPQEPYILVGGGARQ